MEFPLNSEVFTLFAVIAVGKALERIRIGNFSFGIASVFLVAAVAGAMGIVLPHSFQTFGLCVFIYAVGIEAGPQFFASLKAKGVSWLPVPLVFIGAALGLYASCALLLSQWFPTSSFVGLFAGAFTCTPALAAVAERLADPAVSVAFGVVYPFTLAGNVYLIPWLPKLFRHDIEALKKAFDEETRRLYGQRELRLFRVQNPSITGHTVGELRGFALDGVVYTRYIEDGVTTLARDGVTLHEHGLIAAVGTEEGLAKVEMLVGPREQHDVPVPRNLHVRQFIVSNPAVAGRTISSLLMEHPLDVRFTRIVRTGIELCPDSDRQILLGDRITAIGEDEDIDELLGVLGDDMEEAFRARFAPVSIGIAAGFLVGQLPLPLLKSPLGVTAGILLVGMLLGRKVRFATVLWQIPVATTNFLKQFGMSVFFAVVGAGVGPQLFAALRNPQGWLLLGVALALAFLPTVIMYGVATRLLRKNPLDVLGLVAGTVNNSSALAAVNERWKTAIPNTAFAFAYPMGLILVIFSTQILAAVISFIR